MKKMKKVLHDPTVDELLKDKMTEEQQNTLGEFRDVIYEASKKKNGPNGTGSSGGSADRLWDHWDLLIWM